MRTIITLVIICILFGTYTIDAEDLIVNGGTKTVASSEYSNILITNEGTLIVNGNLKATEITILNGWLQVHGELFAQTLDIVKGSAYINDASGTKTQTVLDATVRSKGQLASYGKWRMTNLIIENGGVLLVRQQHRDHKGSGAITIEADSITLAFGSLIDAHSKGNDGRGTGGGFYRDSGAGGYGGRGGRGWWDSSLQSKAYGSQYSYSIQQGSRGGFYGGGAVTLKSKNLTMNGLIDANGRHGHDPQGKHKGSGSGGGVLIDAEKILDFKGNIRADGGTGNGSYGAGGGGRIKIFYGEGLNISHLLQLSAKSGTAKGGNKSSPHNGTIWVDKIPYAPGLVDVGTTNYASGEKPVLSVIALDDGNLHDRDEILFVELEIRDTNNTVVKTYSQLTSSKGWFPSVVTIPGTGTDLTVPDLLPNGTYSWRARVKDESIFGPWSKPAHFIVGNEEDVPDNSTLRISQIVQLDYTFDAWRSYVLEYSDDTETWTPLIDHPAQSARLSGSYTFPPGTPYRFYRIRRID